MNGKSAYEMEFQEYAAREVSALIDRLVSDAEARTEALLDGRQREHDAAMTQVRSKFEGQARELEARVQEKEQLAAAGEEKSSQLAALRSEAEVQRADLETQRREVEHQRRLAAANASAEEELMAARGALDAAHAEAQRLEAEHQRRFAAASVSAKEELLAARGALEAAHAEAQRLEAEHQRSLAAANASAEQELLAARGALDAAHAEAQLFEAGHQRSLAAANASAEEELLAARGALDAAHAEAQRLTRQFDSALEEMRDEHVNTLQQQAVARTVLPLDELLAVFSSLASASTPSAVLTTVVSALGREFSRVALFRVRGSRLECVSHVGFEFEGDIAKVVIPTTVDSLMTRAVNSRRTQTFLTGSSDEPCAMPLGGTPACAVALPLISGDASVAVVYADDSDQLEFGSVPTELLVKFAELVWQHAILVLQRASTAQKMLAIAPVQNFERLA